MKNKIIAYCVGITCHVLFALAICVMAYALFEGLTVSFFPIGENGRVLNILLLAQFPLLHSFLLSKKGRRILEVPYPKEIAKDLSTTTFSLISSLQLLLVFLLWTPNQQIWFSPSGSILYIWTSFYIASWILLIVALSEAGMAMQTGSLGWWAVAHGKKPEYPKLCEKGLHNQCRHPIYLAFSLIILTAPIWSFDHLAISIVWVTYCFLGPLLKEQRYNKMLKNEYQLYQKNTPYMLPKAFHFWK